MTTTPCAKLRALVRGCTHDAARKSDAELAAARAGDCVFLCWKNEERNSCACHYDCLRLLRCILFLIKDNAVTVLVLLRCI